MNVVAKDVRGDMEWDGNSWVKTALEKQVGGDHYSKLKIQPVDYILANEMDYASGNVVKYISRHKSKGGATDIRKAIHYCQIILQTQYGETP
jgi:hypothetical protein